MSRFGVTQAQIAGGIPSVTLGRTPVIRVFKRGIMHDHQPTGGPPGGRWAHVVSVGGLRTPHSAEELMINNIVVTFASTHFRDITPAELMDIIKTPPSEQSWGFIPQGVGPFESKPLALVHLNWFLKTGGGAPFNENAPLEAMLETDHGVIRAIADDIKSYAKDAGDGTKEGYLKIEQNYYSNPDFQFAFGAIDRLSYIVDPAAGLLHAWFMDRYEWHPLYPDIPGMYPAADGKPHSDDEVRDTNVLHAACVELKAGTARDFWMVGEASVPLDPFLNPPSAQGGGWSSTP